MHSFHQPSNQEGREAPQQDQPYMIHPKKFQKNKDKM